MRKLLIVAAGAGVLAAFFYLYAFPPGEGMPYPPCWFHNFTGLHCPGCGATRAVHALLHGDLQQAAAYNVLFLLCLPFLVYWAFRTAVYGWRGRPAPARRAPRWLWPCIAAGLILFGILRNLPLEPFRLLAPHHL